MHDSDRRWGHSYLLVLTETGKACELGVEFEASGAEAALSLAHRLRQGCDAELYEDGRSLGRLQSPDNDGFDAATSGRGRGAFR